MKASTKRHALIGMAMLAAAVAADLASAAEPNHETAQIVVRYSDLDLSQPSDARRFYHRIKSAAREVCDNSPGYDLKLMREYHACMAKAVNDAVNQVRSVQVAAIHRADRHL